MKKIIYMTQWDDDGTYFYRLAPLTFIKHENITIERIPYHGNITWSTLLGYDTLILERPSGQHDLNLIKLAKQCGLKIITDWDDDVLHIDEYNPMYAHYETAKSIVIECLLLSDDVWVSTVGLKKSFGFYNGNIRVIPNAHNDYLFPVANKKQFNIESKKAIWRGGQSHEADVYGVADSLVKTINDNTDWMFQFVGARFIYMEQRCGNNYQPVSMMPLMQYFGYLYKENPNIVFHPLSNTKFNESKSNISFIEATYSGGVFFGNTTLQEFSGVGIMPFDYISEYVEKDRILALQKANEIGWKHIKDNLLLSNINQKRIERLLA